MDLWSQADILTPGLLAPDFKIFRKNYAILSLEQHRQTHRYYYVITGYQNLDKLTAKIQSFASIRKKSECLDLPPKVYKKIMIPLTPEQKQAYSDLKIKAVAWIQDNEITAVNAVSLLNRLLQICAGQIKVGGVYYSIPTHRLDVLQELISETSSPTIVWSAYVNTLTDIHKRLGDQSILLPSGLDSTETKVILNKFRSGEKKVLIANPASFGHGITLVNSSNCIYYSSSFNYEHRAQSEDRIHRIGQHETCQYTDLVAKGTIEGSVLSNLQTKRELSDRVITNKEVLLELLQEA
jgi:SNF2 family DNA or RNA helicase